MQNLFGHLLLLLGSELRIHGQRENFGRDLLCDRKVALLMAQTKISLL